MAKKLILLYNATLLSLANVEHLFIVVETDRLTKHSMHCRLLLLKLNQILLNSCVGKCNCLSVSLS